MALEYLNAQGDHIYVKILHMKHHNDSKKSTVDFAEYSFIHNPIQDGVASPTIVGDIIARHTFTYVSLDAGTMEPYAYAYSLILAIPEYTGAVTV